MNYSLIPMPASEELAMGYVPSASISHSPGEPIPFRVVAALYLLMVLLITQFPSDASSADAQSDAAETGALAEASCEGCIQTTLSPPQVKD